MVTYGTETVNGSNKSSVTDGQNITIIALTGDDAHKYVKAINEKRAENAIK